MSDCTHDCSSCGESCAERQGGSPFQIKPLREGCRVGKVYGVVSGKGGVGKSMVTSQLAVTMQRRGHNVAVLDADITGPSIPKAFGIHGRAAATEDAILPVITGTGIQLMLIFFLCRNRPRLGAALYLLSYLPALMNGWPEDPLCLTVGGLCIDWSIFAVFAAPLIFCATHSRIKINRWFFYAFYPAHIYILYALSWGLYLLLN